MYDTINIAIEACYLECGFENRVASNLKGLQERYAHTTNSVTKCGYLDNYKVIITEQGLLLYGSLAKFYNGAGTSDFLEIKNYKHGIQKLSDRLKVDVNKGKLKRLDFGLNIKTFKQGAEYIPLFLEMPYMKRSEYRAQEVLFLNKV